MKYHYDFNYMTFWKKKNYSNSENIIGCQVFKGGGNGGQEVLPEELTYDLNDEE